MLLLLLLGWPVLLLLQGWPLLLPGWPGGIMMRWLWLLLAVGVLLLPPMPLLVAWGSIRSTMLLLLLAQALLLRGWRGGFRAR
jgi:hypothetical protein